MATEALLPFGFELPAPRSLNLVWRKESDQLYRLFEAEDD
jgi:hypothetical protein